MIRARGHRGIREKSGPEDKKMWSNAKSSARGALGLALTDFLIRISLSGLSGGKAIGQEGWLPKNRDARKAALRLIRHSQRMRRYQRSE